MSKSALKDLLREIKGSFGRFFAIMAIVFIGVAFFAGITASSSDMKHSTDVYYDEYNLCDLRLLSTIGFDDEDIEAIRNIKSIDGVFAGHSMDAAVEKNHIQSTVHIMSLPDDNLSSNNKDYINQLRIKEGRLPNKPGECVIRYENTRELPAAIGETITFTSGTDNDINDELNNDTYTVVGIVYTPYYVSYDLGTSDVGNGHIKYCVMLQDSEFKSEYYTEVFATVNGAKELDTYSDEYFNLVEKAADDVNIVSKQRIESKKDKIKEQYENVRAEKKAQITQGIYDNVVNTLTRQYQIYYPGIDVSSMIQPYIESNYNNALAAFDFDAIDKEIDDSMNEQLAKTDNWKWYEIDRNSMYSFRDYKSSADRMTAIAAVFPVFFIIVAALVCLTTMTRMVDEERQLIGTYKALGYSKISIALKYILYAFLASFIGGIGGCLLGLKLFPIIIYNSWNIIYQLPGIQFAGHTFLSIVAISSMILVTVIASIYACYNELIDMPSVLMRPKAPKSGKKILLEHIPFIWKKLSFTMKVTMRNLFLYKKRFLMTVVGIAGCGALLMAGFGIKDSIQALISNQYGEILHYNVEVRINEDKDRALVEEFVDDFSKDEKTTDYITDYAFTSNITSSNSDNDYDATVAVINNPDKYTDFITFRNRKNHKENKLTDDGIIITEKLADDLNVKKGDTVIVTNKAGEERDAYISDITEMYVGHYIYMTDSYYAGLFEEDAPLYNRVLAKLTDDGTETESQLGEKYTGYAAVKSESFIKADLDKFKNMIKSLDLVTYVLIISAGLLAFVVLYNLTNVNISERVREIATIKVLGFYDPEVGAYVYRENVFITLIGGVAGLLLGVALHSFIMKTIEMDGVMFGNAKNISSYFMAYGLTLLFSVLVNLFMYKKLKNIPMVESLKSVE